MLESNIAAGTSKTNKLCLDDKGNGNANNNPVITWSCNNADKAQQWTPYSDGTIRINGKCLDVTAQKTANNSLVGIFACNGGKNQIWTLTKITSGPAKGKTELLSKQSGKCLDIKKSSTANGAQLEIFTCNGGNNQAWSWGSATSGGGNTQWAYLAPANLHVVSHTTNQLKVAWNKVTGSKPSVSGGVPAPKSYTVAVYRSGSLIRQNTTTALNYTENGLTKGGTVVVHVWANGGPVAPPNASVTVTL